MSGHHISTPKNLLGVAGALLVLTILTVAVHYIHIPGTWSIIVAMALATFKSALVALFFMNLYWDEKINFMLFIAAFVFLALLVGLTLLDTLTRPDITPGF